MGTRVTDPGNRCFESLPRMPDSAIATPWTLGDENLYDYGCDYRTESSFYGGDEGAHQGGSFSSGHSSVAHDASTGLFKWSAASAVHDLVSGCRILEEKEPKSRRKKLVEPLHLSKHEFAKLFSVIPIFSKGTAMYACGHLVGPAEPSDERQNSSDTTMINMSVTKSTAVRLLTTPCPVASNFIEMTSSCATLRPSIIVIHYSLVPYLGATLDHTPVIYLLSISVITTIVCGKNTKPSFHSGGKKCSVLSRTAVAN